MIKREELEFIEKIGSGQFGVVLKAEYKKRKLVAVKKMKPGSKEDEMNFNREADFMMFVPFLVPVYFNEFQILISIF
jgi:serine/threonine protein kinase